MSWSFGEIDGLHEIIIVGLGPFLAVIFSAIGFLVKSQLDKNAEMRESLRMVEVCVAASLEEVSWSWLLDLVENGKYQI